MRRDYALAGVFTAKLPVVVHYLPHQVFDDLLADDPTLLAREFCNFLSTRYHRVTVSPCRDLMHKVDAVKLDRA